ncbi:pyrroline-5-carboxylate reductase [Jeotgalibacillus proteolyticus]|uniref:Pyrroline-5-carboxylate reductase n=1 Tax=Jeotgalibacillus proteolyticus TaxID=2082395 RepID=A0A2S5GA04_9BACL|nr:pyrroline-5-carboxylate reductase [Jeotgalibacillus proteolyticus]PPA69751.1 pyrroline-5-carboxylate reductase [Jeotgalibacillus proteolyticus]
MRKRIGFIGSGKMAQAMMAGMIRSEVVVPQDILISSKTGQTRIKAAAQYGVHAVESNRDAARQADILFLGVTPDLHKEVIEEIKDNLVENVIIVTIAAGLTTKKVEGFFGRKVKVIRTMPNTPSLAGAGMSAMCANELVTEDELAEVKELFRSFGEVEVISEGLMDSIPSISGSSPAYVYMMIEAMADGGVKQGLKRDQAYRLAAQAVYGAAKMVLDTELHPGLLKDQVCSPGGATIDAVSTLEKERFRGAILSAMESCTAKVKELGKD